MIKVTPPIGSMVLRPSWVTERAFQKKAGGHQKADEDFVGHRTSMTVFFLFEVATTCDFLVILCCSGILGFWYLQDLSP